jgi:hypothetical protein
VRVHCDNLSAPGRDFIPLYREDISKGVRSKRILGWGIREKKKESSGKIRKSEFFLQQSNRS